MTTHIGLTWQLASLPRIRPVFPPRESSSDPRPPIDAFLELLDDDPAADTFDHGYNPYSPRCHQFLRGRRTRASSLAVLFSDAVLTVLWVVAIITLRIVYVVVLISRDVFIRAVKIIGPAMVFIEAAVIVGTATYVFALSEVVFFLGTLSQAICDILCGEQH